MKRVILGLALAFAILAAGSAQAAIITFSTGAAGAGGTITHTDGLWFGNNIPVPLMTIADTPNQTGEHMTTAYLNFMYDGTNNPDANWVNVAGYVPGLFPAPLVDDPQNPVWPPPLLYGSFPNFEVMNFPGAAQILITLTGPDWKNPELLAWIGVPETAQWQLLATLLAVPDGQGGYAGFSSSVVDTSVPEPGSMLLLGTGLVGLAAAVRRRIRK